MGDLLSVAKAYAASRDKPIAPKKGMLRGLFDFINLSGDAVQNIVYKGNIEGAARNVADLATGASGLRLIPGLNKYLELSREQDRPDVGLLGEIIFDPLTWIGFPGAGAAKVAKAGGKTAMRLASKALTRPGLKAMKGRAATLADDLLKIGSRTTASGKLVTKNQAGKVIYKRVLDKGLKDGLSREAAEQGAKSAIQQLAERRARREVARGIKSGTLPKWLEGVRTPLQRGGIRASIPFTTGVDVGLQGTDILKTVGKYGLIGQAAKGIARVAPGTVDKFKNAVRKFAPMAFVSEEGKTILMEMNNARGASAAKWQGKIAKTWGWLEDAELRKTIGKAVGSSEPERTVPAMLAKLKDPALKAKVAGSLDEWRRVTAEWADELDAHGFLKDRKKLREWYMPAQLISEQAADNSLDALLRRDPGDFKKIITRGRKPDERFLDRRFTNDIAQIKGAETDILVAGMKRAKAQARLITTSRAYRQANAVFGKLDKGEIAIRNVNRLAQGVLHPQLREKGRFIGAFGKTPVDEMALQAAGKQRQAQTIQGRLPAARVAARGPSKVGAIQQAQRTADDLRISADAVGAEIKAATNKMIPKSLRGKDVVIEGDVISFGGKKPPVDPSPLVSGAESVFANRVMRSQVIDHVKHVQKTTASMDKPFLSRWYRKIRDKESFKKGINVWEKRGYFNTNEANLMRTISEILPEHTYKGVHLLVERVDELKKMNPQQLQQWVSTNKMAGAYDSTFDILKLFSGRAGGETFLHEIGHRMHWHILPRADLDNAVKIYKKATRKAEILGKQPLDGFNEWFADGFTNYVLKTHKKQLAGPMAKMYEKFMSLLRRIWKTVRKGDDSLDSVLERSLKPRHAPPDLKSYSRSVRDIQRLHGSRSAITMGIRAQPSRISHIKRAYGDLVGIANIPDYQRIGSKAAKTPKVSGPFGKLRSLPDGTRELYELGGKGKKNREAIAAAALQYSASSGVPIRLSNKLFHKGRPFLKNLLDDELELYLARKLGSVKPSAFLDFMEKNKYMRTFRAGATVGLGPFVNPAFAARNILTATAFQSMQDPQMGLAGFKHIRPLLEGLVNKVSKKFGAPIKGGKVFRVLNEDAIQRGLIEGVESGIDSVKQGAYTGRQMLDLAKKHAVIRQGYTGSELISDAARKTKTFFPKWADESGEFIENSFRMSAYMDLLGKGADPVTAARQVGDMFVDYRYQSNADRTVRALFPFSRFTMAQTPETLKAVGRSPRLTQPLRALMAGPASPTAPSYLGDAPNISAGTDSEGKPLTIPRLGLPLEDLSTFGTGQGPMRTLEQSVLSRLNPLARYPLESITGRSFFMGKQMEGMRRAPEALPDPVAEILGGKTGGPFGTTIPADVDAALRALPISRQINEINKLLDKKKPVWARSLDFIAGVKVRDIDEDVELKRMLRDYLVREVNAGNLGKVNSFFATGDTDPELTAILKTYYKIGKGSGKKGTKPPASQ